MDFRVPAELSALRESFGSFLQREVAPVEARVREHLVGGERDQAVVHQAAREVTAAGVRDGFYAPHMPAVVGGQGLSTLGTTLLVEDAARSGLRLAIFALGPPDPSAPSPLLLGLPEHLWPRYIAPLMRGETTMCFALTEPEAGSDAQSIQTRAVRDGDEWVLTGRKHYITNGAHADLAVVFAVTDPELRAAGGITAFCVPQEGFEVGRTQWTMADTHPSELVLDGTRIPADHVIGEVGFGFGAAMRFLNAGRAAIGAQCLGLAEHCLDVAIAHTRERTAFGKPLSRFQGVSFPLAESKAEIESLRWLTYHLAWAVDEGEEPMLDASIVKFLATERAFTIADRCLQALGGQGLMRDGGLEWVQRHLRMLRVVEGASEVQLLVISRVLGL